MLACIDIAKNTESRCMAALLPMWLLWAFAQAQVVATMLLAELSVTTFESKRYIAECIQHLWCALGT